MALATGVGKELRYGVESVFGTASVAAGQQLRRVTSTLDLVKDSYQSQEIISHYQIQDFRHGTRRAEGSINGELSPGTYADLLEAALRRDFTAAITTTAITDVTADAGGKTFTRSTGSYLTNGFRVGMVVRWSGFAGGSATDNNGRNYLITALTATVMTVDGPVVSDAAGDTVTCSIVGQVTWTPTTGHTNKSFTFEHWHGDVSQSERFLGCRINTVELGLPPSGMATIGLGVLGQNMATAASALFGSPAAATTTGIGAAVNGVIRVGGTALATVTGLSISVAGGMSTGQVVGSNMTPDVFAGRVNVTGQLSAYFENGDLRDAFLDEDEVDVYAQLTLSNAANADFIGLYLPRVKFGGASKSDGEQGLIQTLPFQALRQAGVTGGVESTILIQDSTLS